MFGLNENDMKILKFLAKNHKIAVSDGQKLTKNIWRFNCAIKKLIEVGILIKTDSKYNTVISYELSNFGEDFCLIMEFHGKI